MNRNRHSLSSNKDANVHFVREAVKLLELRFSENQGDTNAESDCDHSNQQGHDQI